MSSRPAVLLMVLLAACEGGGPGPAPAEETGEAGGGGTGPAHGVTCAPGELAEGPGCAPAGLPESACAPGELPSGSGCRAAGVAACAPGFSATGDGSCAPVLPSGCPEGRIAVPGDAACRPLSACPEDPKVAAAAAAGPLPIAFVDPAHEGPSDGSEARPWTSIADAVAAAPAGALVALAAGTYAEDVAIDRPLHLWAPCPEIVEIVGSGASYATLTLEAGAVGASVRGVALRGPGAGVLVRGAAEVRLERLWIHDTGYVGLDVEEGASSVRLEESLLERCGSASVLVIGSELDVVACAVRDGRPDAEGRYGRGVSVLSAPGLRARVGVERSLVEGSREMGLFAMGADLRLDASVVRGTRAQVSDGTFGVALAAQSDAAGERASAVVAGSVLEASEGEAAFVYASDLRVASSVLGTSRGAVWGYQGPAGPASIEVEGSVLEKSRGVGLVLFGSRATLRSTVLRDGLPFEDGTFGSAVRAEGDGALRASIELEGCALERHLAGGIELLGSDATLVSTALRNIAPEPASGIDGSGLLLLPLEGEPSTLAMRGSLVERAHLGGVVLVGAEAVIDASVVRGTLPQEAPGEAPRLGRGIIAQEDFEGARGSTLRLSRSLVEQNHEVGVFVAGSEAEIERTIVRDTLAVPGDRGGGRGIGIESNDFGMRAAVSLRGVVVERSREMGVFVYGSDATIEGLLVRDTFPNEATGKFGDGITVFAEALEPATVSIARSRVESSARAGVAVFAAGATLGATDLACNAIDLAVDAWLGQRGALHDAGGNFCGCDAPETCRAISPGLEPPEPL